MYPFDSLVIITPIIFFVLLIGFAVIGVFGGWKRAAYWGGGNFVFYCIGLLIWFLAKDSISGLVTTIIQQNVPQLTDPSSIASLATSIASPLFFILFMILINIILVICYYTFVKKLLGLKKPKQEKEQAKAVSKTKQAKVAVQTKKGVVHTRWFNMVVGGVGMTVLMLPITFTTTHAIAFTTTKSSTRAKNALTNSLYNCCQGIAGSMDWFSYYSGSNTGKDYDALFSLISLATRNDISYIDANGDLQTGSPISALSGTITTGVANLVKNTKTSGVSLESAATIAGLVEAIDNFSTSFDSIMNQCKDDINALFNSSSLTSVVKSVISSSEATIEITNEQFEQQYLSENNVFDEMVKGYKQGYIETKDGVQTPIVTIQNPITTSEEAFNDIVDAIYDMYPLNNLTATNQTLLREKTAEMIQMFITY